MNFKIKGIIFDLDGTLIDSLLDLTESVNYALKKINLEIYPPEKVKEFVGNGMRSLIESAINQAIKDKNLNISEANSLKEECFQFFLKHYDKNCINQTNTFYGVEDFLIENQHNFKFAILTNKSEYFTKKILNHLNLTKYFTHILTGDKENYKKPNPDGIIKIQNDWGFTNKEILMIGDHYIDIQTAKAASVKSVFAIYGYGKLNGSIPDHSIKNFTSLKPLLNLIG